MVSREVLEARAARTVRVTVYLTEALILAAVLGALSVLWRDRRKILAFLYGLVVQAGVVLKDLLLDLGVNAGVCLVGLLRQVLQEVWQVLRGDRGAEDKGQALRDIVDRYVVGRGEASSGHVSTAADDDDLPQLTTAERNLLCGVRYPQRVESPWQNISGYESVLELIEDNVLTAATLKLYHSSHVVGQVPSLLLYGPPGCGKTIMAEAIADAMQLAMIVISPAAVKSKWVGESENNMKAAFTLAVKLQPCIIFIDEVDLFFVDRQDRGLDSGILATFLLATNKVAEESDILIIVIAATNTTSNIDPAILRRFPLTLHVDKPDQATRKKILHHHLCKQHVDAGVDLDSIAKATKNFTGSDLKNIVQRAASQLHREYVATYCKGQHDPKHEEETDAAFHRRHHHVPLSPITQDHLVTALQQYKKCKIK
ncbi:outer mitochondrial transmembrane helix translocase-like [Procambarus clarkii]|uniref:outer mitochondrial transmembrane helix translocase-like n=1 Tax=Procambarus clarkii TaxID=6728 RepID=UPI001E671A7A|nr:outer mitochondrial transmembrane helix translocase-like [Procambarus clarkii]